MTLVKPDPVTDPVCGMRIDPSTAAARVSWKGSLVHFCSVPCSTKFQANPESFVRPPSLPSCCGGSGRKNLSGG